MKLTRVIASSPVNLIVNNLFWAGCVIGRYDFLWIVAPAIMGYVALLVYARTIDIKQLSIPICLGILIDSVYTAVGLFQFEHHSLLLPLWMCMLWIAFSTTLPLSMRLLGRNYTVAALTGAVGFPFSYYLGYKLDAVSFGLELPLTLLVLALTWAVFLPLMFRWTTTRQMIFSEAV